MMYFPLKQYVYYTTPQQLETMKYTSACQNKEIQLQCYNTYFGYFNKDNLSELLNHLLTVTMLREKPEDMNNVQMMIEEDCAYSIDEIHCELDCSIKKLC